MIASCYAINQHFWCRRCHGDSSKWKDYKLLPFLMKNSITTTPESHRRLHTSLKGCALRLVAKNKRLSVAVLLSWLNKLTDLRRGRVDHRPLGLLGAQPGAS